MESLIAAAGRALLAGNVLGALNLVALRDDPPALALRGIAMARLGDYARARDLLRRAARGFGPRESLARARCIVAQAEVALAMRDLRGSPRQLASAVAALDAHADRANAVQGQLVAVRRLLLLGRFDEAASLLATIDTSDAPPALIAVAEIAAAELALRCLRTSAAGAAIGRARQAAGRAGLPALLAEVTEASAALDRPAARRIRAGQEQLLRLDEVAALLATDALVVDACRHGLHCSAERRALARRPVLFALLLALAKAWPEDADRNELIMHAFRTRRPDETHRARLRVEIGRIRSLVAPLARVEASARGFRLAVPDERDVVVLVPPIDGDKASLVALLADGAAWSSFALAQVLGASQRSIQRALAQLEAEGRAYSIGSARARRWHAPPLVGFTTILLLPAVPRPG